MKWTGEGLAERREGDKDTKGRKKRQNKLFSRRPRHS
jgi:hypothetical protein